MVCGWQLMACNEDISRERKWALGTVVRRTGNGTTHGQPLTGVVITTIHLSLLTLRTARTALSAVLTYVLSRILAKYFSSSNVCSGNQVDLISVKSTRHCNHILVYY